MKTLAFLFMLVQLVAAPASAAGIEPAKTKVVRFAPGMMATHTQATGYCWTASIASQRADAFRCMVSNEIYDPCFAVNAKTVACPQPANVRSGVRISLTKPLPLHSGKAADSPWMMQLSTGIVCSMGTGTVVENHPFECTKNLVCSAPPVVPKGEPVFVSCGVAKSAVSVVQNGRYLVTALYE